MPKINLTTIPPSIRDFDCQENNTLFDERDHRIIPGQLFEITTDNPEIRPLPSIALLEMQWFLQRVMGVAGAADVEEDHDYYFSDSEVSNLALADNNSLRP
jgi:hypothetical protein